MSLRLENVHFAYGDRKILDGIDLSIEQGSFVSILGSSGSGKSTILKLAAGIMPLQQGRVIVSTESIVGLSQHFAYMPQEDLLLEWETVYQNVCLYHRINHLKVDEAMVLQKIKDFGLEGYEHSYPKELSGGMRQRVAFLRTALCEAKIMLLDEPFGSLDVISRNEMQDWLQVMRHQFNKTIVMVSHDLDEAIYLSDKILILEAKPAQITQEITLNEKQRTRHWLYQQSALREQLYTMIKGE